MQKVKVVLDQTDNDDTESVIKVLEKRIHISVLSAYIDKNIEDFDEEEMIDWMYL